MHGSLTARRRRNSKPRLAAMIDAYDIAVVVLVGAGVTGLAFMIVMAIT